MFGPSAISFTKIVKWIMLCLPPSSCAFQHVLQCVIFVFMQRYPDTIENEAIHVFLLHAAVGTPKRQPFQGEGSTAWSRCMCRTHHSRLKSQNSLVIMKIQVIFEFVYLISRKMNL